MKRNTSVSIDFVHKYYECFLNSYKTFITISNCLHIIEWSNIEICKASIYEAVRSMDGA
jgi:hypothetical protein